MTAGLASLIEQRLLHGYLAHEQQRFAIPASSRDKALDRRPEVILSVGFPPPWRITGHHPAAKDPLGDGRSVSSSSSSSEGEVEEGVPGWVREEDQAEREKADAKIGPGMVVNLSGARPVGEAG